MRILVALLFLVPLRARALVDEPAGCWTKKAWPCAVRGTAHEWLSLGENKIRLNSGTGILLKSEGEGQLLEGRLWVESENGFSLTQGIRRFTVRGEAWLKKDQERLQLWSFSGQTGVDGPIKGEAVIAGFENWWELSTQGLMRPFESKKVLPEWNRWMRLDGKETSRRVTEYREAWQNRQETAANFYQEITQRRIASVEEAAQARADREERKRQESARLRRMFRDRYYHP